VLSNDERLQVEAYLTHKWFTAGKAATAFDSLPGSGSIPVGTASVTLSGTVSAAGPVYPANGETVHVAINGVTHDTTISGDAGAFSIDFDTSTLPASGTPYTITYTYDGSSTLANTHDNSTALTVTDPYGDWIKGYYPGGGADALRSADPDHDGLNNLGEFAFHSVPNNPASRGLFFTEKKNNKVNFTCAVRRSATVNFTANSDGAQTATIDGVTYIIEGSATLSGTWNSPVTSYGKSDSPPTGSSLPSLSGADWEYRTFTGFDGLGGKGFLRARVTAP